MPAVSAQRKAVMKYKRTIQQVRVLAVLLCLAAFLVSLAAIRGLMQYVKKHSFSAFGIYRIALGVVVLVYGLLAK